MLLIIHFTFTLVDTPIATLVADKSQIAILKTAETYEDLSSELQDVTNGV